MSPGIEAATTAVSPRPWTIVTQVKSHRVVFFTDDPQYRAPEEGDWCYCSPFEGELPQGMTLRNCWGWRFDGSAFVDAREAPRREAAQSLMESNRRALRKLLIEKIEAARAPWLPSCAGGESVRQRKAEAARAFLEGRLDDASAAWLEGVAVARRTSLTEAAHLVLARQAHTERVLRESERFREQLSQAIDAATTQAQLLELRQWLLDKVYPQLSRELRFNIDNTRPLDLDQPLGETHRVHEVARLKARLREVINAQRKDLDSGYVRNEEVWRHKVRIAQAVIANGGNAPAGMDCGLLQAYAQARGLTLESAAVATLALVAGSASVLAQTEAMKDQWLARVDAIRTLRDVRDVDSGLEKLLSLTGQASFPNEEAT